MSTADPAAGSGRAQNVRRFGDRSLENVIRTDERYGHDGLFQGPRGLVYWNSLENARPIQNPNLWSDTQSTYFFRLVLPAGCPERSGPAGGEHAVRRHRRRADPGEPAHLSRRSRQRRRGLGAGDSERMYTIVVSRHEDRPKNATEEHGVAWVEWSPRGEGLDDPRNRADLGMLLLRMMANDPTWAESPDKVTEPGTEAAVMGPYYPRGYYTTREAFEAGGVRK